MVKFLFNDYDLGFVNSDDFVWGNYLYGIFDNGFWCCFWLNILCKKWGFNELLIGIVNYKE